MRRYTIQQTHFAIALFGVAILMAASSGVSAQATTQNFAGNGQIVVTENGPVSGTVTADGRKFLGIPYAKAPTGALRWKAPAAPQNWTTTRPATQFGSTCPQAATPFGFPSTNEDCLFVNVYTPPVSLISNPVVVWIHPGAFQYGEGSGFDPKKLVAKGVVVVTLNYRLGALGWLAHPALTAEGGGSSGNYGFLDQQAALKWVKRNIIKFGGNPLKVTIAGESAGGLSVSTHMAAPSSAGLFQQAITQSGAYALALSTLATAETQGTAYASAVGCASGDLACLRAVPVATLLANQSPSPSAYLPRVDGKVLPKSIQAAFTAGTFNKVPVLQGSTHDEFTLFIATQFTLANVPVVPAGYPNYIAAILGLTPAAAQVVVPLVIQQYPLANYTSTELALAAIGTDAAFACNAALTATLLAPSVATYWYEFDDPDAPQVFLPPVPYDYGAYHGSELKYLFNVRETVPGTFTPAQQQLSDAMVLNWSTFAKLGSPSGLLWPRFAPPLSQRVQLLTPPLPQSYTATAFAADHKCSFWQQIAAAGGS